VGKIEIVSAETDVTQDGITLALGVALQELD